MHPDIRTSCPLFHCLCIFFYLAQMAWKGRSVGVPPPLSIFKSPLKLTSTLQKNCFQVSILKRSFWKWKNAPKCYIITIYFYVFLSLRDVALPSHHLFPLIIPLFICTLAAINRLPLSQSISSDMQEQQEVRDWRVGGRRAHSCRS